jgi:hypothetical protein
MSETTERRQYEAPIVTDFGSVEELTQGQINIAIDDFPIGANASLSLPIIGPLPSLPPIGS